MHAQESSSLFRAAYKGRLDELRFLLAAGADVNSRDWVRPSRSNARCAEPGQTRLFRTRRLVQNGSAMQLAPSPLSRLFRLFRQDGSTALVAATYAEQLDAVALLLAAGADVAAANDDGDVPLMFAAMRGNAPLIELLLDAGADANSVNKVGGTPLMYAASNGQAAAIPLLMLRGADPGARDAAGRTASDIAATVPPMQEAVRAALRGAQAEE